MHLYQILAPKVDQWRATGYPHADYPAIAESVVRLVVGDSLILETKGLDTEQDHVKWKYLAEWVEAVNQQGGFGRWRWDVAKQPGDVLDILAKHSGTNAQHSYL